jgi:hypothetical protein
MLTFEGIVVRGKMLLEKEKGGSVISQHVKYSGIASNVLGLQRLSGALGTQTRCVQGGIPDGIDFPAEGKASRIPMLRIVLSW